MTPATVSRSAMSDVGGLPLLDATPGHLVRCAQQIHGNLWTKEIGNGLTSVQFAVLLAIAQSPGIDQRTVGRRASLDKSTAADVVGRLAQRGLVTRARGEDGRRRILHLADEGATVLLDAAPGVMKVQEDLLAPLAPTDRGSLLQLLRSVAHRARPPASGSPGTHVIADPRWRAQIPDICLQEVPGHLVRRAQQVHTSAWSECVTSVVSSVQYNVLLVLHHHPGIDQRTLGALASLDKSTGGEVVARMVERRLVERARDAGDARRNLLWNGVCGEALLFERARAVVEVQELLLAPLDDREGRLFMTLTAQLVDTHARTALGYDEPFAR